MKPYETNYQHYAGTPEALANALVSGLRDDIFCASDCENDDDCPHPVKCTLRWLNEPYQNNDQSKG